MKNIHRQNVKKIQLNLRFDPKTRTQSKKIRSYEKYFQKKAMNLKTMKLVEKFEYSGSAGYLEGLEGS